MREDELRFPAKDLPLREDVSTLGSLVGEVLREQGGEALFDRVEAARRAAIRRRGGEQAAEEELSARVSALEPAEAERLVRAFATYFQVVNLAEKTHRIRRRRDHQRGTEPQEGSTAHTVRLLAAAGKTLDEVRALLFDLAYEPVFTAHPTEAVRRTILEKQLRIMRRLGERLDPSRTPSEERVALARIRAEVTAGWQTEEHPSERPTVADEREHVLFFVTRVLYRVIPVFYEMVEEALIDSFGEGARWRIDQPMPVMIRFASWVGGDMDGNPNVSARTIRETLTRHRSLILRLFRTECAELARHLSQSRSRIGVSPQIDERIAFYGQRFPEALAAIRPRYRQMPYRTLLWLMEARLDATLDGQREGYHQATTLIEDLCAIARSLEAHRGSRAGLFGVRRLLRRVETFGFHLATLDVRQDSMVHRAVIGRLLGDEGWSERPAVERAARLRRALEGREAPSAEPDEEAEATLEVFRAIGECRQRHGAAAIGPYIISMAQGVDDVLAVLLLARWAGLGTAPTAESGEKGGVVSGTVPLDPVPLDVAPLFETVPDLEAAPAVMRELTGDPLYRRHLAGRGDVQVVMIGYSDSNKDGGLAASRWALQKGQAALVAVLEEAQVGLTLFHGRGGTISRGGGKTMRAVLAAPRGAVAGRLRVTEQGEVINAKFGVRAIALRTLEQATSAVALATALPPAPDEREPRWHAIMDGIADTGRRVYRELVYEDPDFVEYFRRATPIDVIERMTIGSRPASRRSGAGVENLRAIPWVFSWTQSRHLLPGWYGLGTALARAVDEHGEEAVAAMVADWRFAGAMLDDVEMVLAKADLGVAQRYATLAGEVGERLFPRIRAEFDRTVEVVLALKGAEALLDSDPTLQRSIQLRNPYVDPMSLLQVDLLARWRATGREDAALLAALLATVNGIAQGLQNTG